MSRDLKGRRIAFLTLIILIIAVGLIYINSRYLTGSDVGTSSSKNLSIESELEAASNNSDIFYCIDEFALEAQGTVIRARKVTGEQAWSMNLGGTIKSVSTCGNAILVLDEKNTLYYMNKQGKILWSSNLEGEPWDVFGEDNGCVLIEYKDSEGSKIEVFDGEGTSIGKAALKNAYVLAFAADKNKDYVISVLDITSEKLKSRIITYSSNGQMVWAKDFNNEIITYVHFLKGEHVLASGSSQLSIFNMDGNLNKEYKLEGKLKNIAASDEMIAVVVNNKGKYRGVTLDCYLEVYQNIKLDIIPDGIFVNGTNYILYNKDKLMYGSANSDVLITYKSISDIVAAYLTSEDSIYIVSNRKLQALNFKK